MTFFIIKIHEATYHGQIYLDIRSGHSQKYILLIIKQFSIVHISVLIFVLGQNGSLWFLSRILLHPSVSLICYICFFHFLFRLYHHFRDLQNKFQIETYMY